MLFRRRLPSDLSLDELLDAVPVRNTAVRSERKGKNLVLWIRLKKRGIFEKPLKAVLPLRDEKGVWLDDLGEEVWKQCDGHTRVEKIVERFAEKHQLRFHEARVSVMQFIAMLVERRLLAVAVSSRQPAVGDLDASSMTSDAFDEPAEDEQAPISEVRS